MSSIEAIRPVSLNEFKEQTGISDAEVIRAHSNLLVQYRIALAAELGISLEDLHEMRGIQSIETYSTIR